METIKIKTDDIIVVCGKRGSGKSVFVRYLAKHLKRRIIWDINFEHTNLGYVLHYPHQIKGEFKRGITRIVFQPYDKTEEAFDNFCKTCFGLIHYTLIIEEVERYATSYKIPGALKKIIDVGRHYGIGLIVTCRRVARLNPDVPFNANHIIIFHLHRPQDAQYLAEWVGDIVLSADLSDYKYLHYSDHLGKCVLRQRVPLEG